MTDNRQPQDDPLDEAVKAFQQMAVPDRPPDVDVLARLDAAGEVTQPAPVLSSLKRRYLMRLVVPSTAALVLLGGAALFFLTATPAPTLADVVKAAEKHKLVKYTHSRTLSGTDGAVGREDKVVYADLKALRVRSETLAAIMVPGDQTKFIEEVLVSIQDVPNDRMLMTTTRPAWGRLPARKDAWLGRIGGEKKVKSFLEHLQEFQQKEDVTQIKDKLDGRETIKYRLEEDGKTTALWVDVTTKLPVRMEYETVNDASRTKTVLTDFEWDPKLPKDIKDLDALFDLTPPRGYQVTDETKKDKPADPAGEKAAPPPDKKGNG